MQKFLVFGASGFIGANLIRKLLGDYNVEVVVKPTSNTWRIQDLKGKLKTHYLVSFDLKELKDLMQEVKPDFIVNLAAHGSYPSQKDIEEMIKTNILLTCNLLEASTDIDYTAYINIGSSSEYGFKDKAMNESDVLEPTSFYAASKASGTLICQTWAKIYNRNIVTLRPFSIYGPWEERKRFIPTIITNLLENKEINLTGGGEVRDFVYVDDFCDAIIKAARNPEKISGRIINVGSGIEYKLPEVVQTLFRVIGKEVKINIGGYEKREWDTNHWVADNRLAKETLNWTPSTNLETGLEKSVQWFSQNRKLYE